MGDKRFSTEFVCCLVVWQLDQYDIFTALKPWSQVCVSQRDKLMCLCCYLRDLFLTISKVYRCIGHWALFDNILVWLAV